MKKILTIAAALMMTASVWAQTPEKMSYQAVVRNASDALVTSTAVGMQLSILQGSATGTAVYTETQTPNTNINGLVSLEIGTGTTTDDFSTIDWTTGPYFIKTETDPTGGTSYTISGTSQLMSVPFALHAKTAANGITAAQTTAITANTAKVDQTISRTGTTVTLTNGGTFTDSVNTYTAGTNITIANNVISASGHYVGELFGGGIVYYVYDNGAHGLIASLDDLDGGSGVVWGLSGTDVPNCESAWDGATNTASTITAGATASQAPGLCNAYSGGGNNDWYLPSSWELSLLYTNAFIISKKLDSDAIITTNGFQFAQIYWSSSEISSTLTWGFLFSGGYSVGGTKTVAYRVRAVRAF